MIGLESGKNATANLETRTVHMPGKYHPCPLDEIMKKANYLDILLRAALNFFRGVD